MVILFRCVHIGARTVNSNGSVLYEKRLVHSRNRIPAVDFNLHWYDQVANQSGSGVFGSLVFDVCCFQKEYRSIVVMLVNLPNLILVYKLLVRREYPSFLLSASCLVCFFVGGIVYCQERPALIEGIMGHHEIFHLLAVIGFGLIVGANGFVIK
ncbi:conserved hypothetical protein [Theileria orientalis strain Shintoku]|uniref:Uncharacterized protein n=1 Tax=Theileria orientalis strain Shintoku TaxID=869250 RepID=J7MC76_THEOR|nr:conserved hypothetical protein [Theileria orientalis strain Shintoku]BAM42332.1 conserved hypothetical protein [Theileria orientalis strain Shintoku]|eukprot:XP_009692633.1 conserved hypothetical protein [Theileria orientalis strain Shintoku]